MTTLGAAARCDGLAAEVRRAVDCRELTLHFQPQLDSRSHQVVGVESLLRWQHPERGLEGPAELLAAAESEGLMPEIGDWVLRSSCLQLRNWLDEGLPALRLAVNLSHLQLEEPSFVERAAEILESTGVPPSLVDFELSERSLGLGRPGTAETLAALKDLGARVAIDDFGTGPTLAGYLSWLPLDVLKIDRSFVGAIAPGNRDAQVISRIIRTAHRLGLEVVAEGVETRNQFGFLAEQNCDLVQGFLFARPLPFQQFRQALGPACFLFGVGAGQGQ